MSHSSKPIAPTQPTNHQHRRDKKSVADELDRLRLLLKQPGLPLTDLEKEKLQAQIIVLERGFGDVAADEEFEPASESVRNAAVKASLWLAGAVSQAPSQAWESYLGLPA